MGYLLCMYVNHYEEAVAEDGNTPETITECSLTQEEIDEIEA